MSHDSWLDLLVGVPLFIGAVITFLPPLAIAWGLR